MRPPVPFRPMAASTLGQPAAGPPTGRARDTPPADRAGSKHFIRCAGENPVFGVCRWARKALIPRTRGGERLLLLPALLVAAGLLVGLFFVLQPELMTPSDLEADPLSPRISAEVRSGEEQVMIHLARSLA